jgi:hypothetical protein
MVGLFVNGCVSYVFCYRETGVDFFGPVFFAGVLFAFASLHFTLLRFVCTTTTAVHVSMPYFSSSCTYCSFCPIRASFRFSLIHHSFQQS